jgi:hypothetical protein
MGYELYLRKIVTAHERIQYLYPLLINVIIVYYAARFINAFLVTRFIRHERSKSVFYIFGLCKKIQQVSVGYAVHIFNLPFSSINMLKFTRAVHLNLIDYLNQITQKM